MTTANTMTWGEPVNRVGWLLGMNLLVEKEFEKLTGNKVKWLRFQESESALDSIKDTQDIPCMILGDDANALSVLENSDVPINSPVIVLAKNESFDSALRAMNAGAVDYVHQAIPSCILAAKIHHQLENQTNNDSNNLRKFVSQQLLQEFEIDNVYRRITAKSGVSAVFTSKEFQIVMTLDKRSQDGITRSELIHEVWNGVKVGQKTLDVHLFNIRKKIATLGLQITFEAPNSYRICKQ